MRWRRSVQVRLINRTAAVLIDSVVVIARVQSGLAVSSVFGSFLVALATQFVFQCYHTYNVTYTSFGGS